MGAYLRAIGRGFALAWRFSGRDGRGQFWPYALFLFLLSQIGMAAAMAPVMVAFQRFAVEHPERTTVTTGPGQYSVAVSGPSVEIGSAMAGMTRIAMFIAAAFALLAAASVARRLHDCGRSGLWGLAPLPFLGGGLFLMGRLFAGSAGGETDGTMFLGAFLNNLAYLAAFGLLVYWLVAKGTPGPNRFGPPPA
jgi:uncharacterized membrane protein YhaH (DUF805 family)